MQAVITRKPILVAVGSMDRSSQNTDLVGSFVGPQLTVGVNRYAALSDNVTPGFHVYKSTNGGQDWTLMDAAHEPALVSFPLYKIDHDATSFSFVWEGDGGDVPANDSLGLARFDCTTDTWSAVFQSVANMTTNTPLEVIAERSDRSIIAIFQAQNPAPGNLQYGIWDAVGTFTGPFDFNTTSTTLEVVSAVTGPDDTIHVLVQDGSGPFDISYQTLSPLNVVSAPAAVATLGSGTPDSFLSGLPIVDTELNQILFPFSDQAGSPTHTAMFVGTPISAPVWTQHTLETGLPAGHYAFPISHKPPSGALLIFQTVDPFGPLLQLWYTPWNGTTLGTPVLYYDGVNNPPEGGPIQEILKVSVSQFSPILGLVAMQLTPDSPPENTYFLPGPCPTNAQGVV